ncbi:MAG: hypothetical protein AAGD11_15695 [Planctomycetota bacterium]
MQWTIKSTSLFDWRATTMTAATLLLFSACSATSRSHASPLDPKLERKITVTWQGQELGTAVQRLSTASDISVWLDRRVDPQRKVSLQVVNQSTWQALNKLTKENELGFSQLRELIYIAPRPRARELTTLVQHARKSLDPLPRRVHRRWTKSAPVDWPRLSEPRMLIEAWLAAADVQIVNAEAIPHDLLPARSLPTLAMIDRLVLLLAGFDLTCQASPDGSKCLIVPIQRPLRLTGNTTSSQSTSRSPNARRTKTADSKQLFTLRLKNQPLGRVLDRFSKQLKLEITWATPIEDDARERLISCDVTQVELDDLLGEVLKSTELQHRLEGTRVTIEPRR